MIHRSLVRFREADAAGAGPAAGTHRAEQAAKPDRSLLCHACGQLITSESARRPVDGAHVHDHTNPAGYHYRIGCFSAAPGCAGVGPPSGEHTWFAGCVWRLAICGACGEHLGWAFSGADEFYGLILDRLTKAAG